MANSKIILQREGVVRLSQIPVGKWTYTTGFYARYVFVGFDGQKTDHYNVKKFREQIKELYIK